MGDEIPPEKKLKLEESALEKEDAGKWIKKRGGVENYDTGDNKVERLEQRVRELEEEVERAREEKRKVKEGKLVLEQERREVEEEKKMLVEGKRNIEEQNSNLVEENSKLREKNISLAEKNKKLFAENVELVDENCKWGKEICKYGEENCRLGERSIQLMDENGKLKTANTLIEQENRNLSEAKNQIMEERCSLEAELHGSKTVNQAENLWLNQRVDELEQEVLDVQEETGKETRQLKKVVKDLKNRLATKEKVLGELQRMVECPVCLSLPREGPAVPCCPKGHFVCSQCLQQMKAKENHECPTCREPMGEGKSLLAFTVVKQAKHECRLKGCTELIPFDEIKQHEEECNWRLVICPGSGVTCKAMVPFQKVEEHAKDCPDFTAAVAHDEGTGVSLKRNMAKRRVENQESVKWGTQVVKHEGQIFFGRLMKEGSIFTLDVAMKANEEDCEAYLVEASMMDVQTGKLMFKSIFPPRPLAKENNPGFCLVVPQKAMAKVWKLNENVEKYSFVHHIKVNRNIRV